MTANRTSRLTTNIANISSGLILPVWDNDPGDGVMGDVVYMNGRLKYFDGTKWFWVGETKDIIPVTTGLLSWYDGSSWDSSNNRWSDRSGSGNNTSNTVGTVTVGTHSGGSGANKSFQFISGNTAAGVRISSPAWPSSGDYTFFHVTRYTGGTRGRIWQGTAGNWLSGHWSNGSGRFFHEGWLSSSGTNYFNDDWFITMDQNNFVRTNRGQHTFSSGGNYNPGGVAINSAGSGGCCNSSETSAWACAFAAVYNRKLSSAEYESVENYLYNKYFA